jgi:hypothetical protein
MRRIAEGATLARDAGNALANDVGITALLHMDSPPGPIKRNSGMLPWSVAGIAAAAEIRLSRVDTLPGRLCSQEGRWRR